MATQQQIDPVAASAAAREAEERAREDAAARRRHEAEVLKTAAEIRARRAFGRMNPHPEYRRGKTHWDHLLEEMTWLAKEFQRERRWKLQQARKAANAVARSNKDLESRVEVRAREEEKTLRRRASWIAREVTNFWGKAQRVVAFKVKTEVEAKKKEVMDRQLEALLGQTQKYSSLLAARLGADEKAEAVAAASKAAPQRAHIAVPSIKEEPVAGPSTSLQRETLQVPRPASVAPSAAHSANLDLGDGDDSQEYRSGEDDDADDEATLEEEERLAAAEGQDATEGGDAEAAALAEDADLPLEELLARYGYVVTAGAQEVSHVAEEEGGAGPSMTVAAVAFPKTRYEVDVASEDEGGGGGGGGGEEGIGALLQNPLGYTPPPPSRLAAEFASLEAMEGGDDIDAAQMDDQAKASEPSTTRSRSSGKAVGARRAIAAPAGGRAVTAGDEDEYRSGEDDDADDEATLEEEERLAAAEGQDATREGQVEAAGLAEDAELPLEELLARYGYVSVEHDNDTATLQAEHAEADRTQEPLPSSAAPGAATDGGASAPEPLGGEEDESRPIDAETGTDADRIAGAMEALAAAQPTGYTLDTTKVKTPVPFLLKGQLREYQHIGLDWLVTLYHRRLNGILADEMGLGKTIQTIALLAWLACERGDWGPHLVVVPTSVMLNWEMEFKRWAPAFKLLTYYGSPKERAAKRQGWSKPNAFHVCITSYTLVLQDARMFKRKKWKYLILDEAHMIKNWRSQRWQTLLNFNSKRRLLITGTPLQNDLMELWSLMHFLMPQIFASHAQFKDWFSNPLTGMVEGSAEYNCAIVDRLHGVLRPFLLRRLKRDVEKQLPGKHEHVVKCRLSKRQRQLYEEYMSSGDTRATLASGNFLGIMNCLMQLRKVCNHPDLFEGRPIVSAWDMPRLELRVPSAVTKMLGNVDALQLRRDEETALTATSSTHVRTTLGLMPVTAGHRLAAWQMEEVRALAEPSSSFDCPATSPQEDLAMLLGGARGSLLAILRRTPSRQSLAAVTAAVQVLAAQRRQWRSDRTAALGRISLDRTRVKSGVSWDFAIAARVQRPAFDAHEIAAARDRPFDVSDALLDMIKLPDRRAEELEDVFREFVFVIPRARAALPELWCSRPDASAVSAAASAARTLSTTLSGAATALLHVPSLRTQLFFPDRRLVQFDCGKLQEMAALLGRLKLGGHRALIFTQMSRMLDILESFLNIYGYTYVRLDGATKPETRQVLMQRFNTDSRIFCFILSTRSGGVGMNLTGADTVIFYDSDWNPAMDAQAQDRCHRIGQTREVHIYRLISEHTIEENILRKSDQKRQLDWLAIQSGGFTTDLLSKFDPKALLTGGAEGEEESAGAGVAADGERTGGVATTTRQDAETIRAAMRAAEDEGDAAAAAAVEREAAAEMDEFIKEPPPGAVNGLEDEQNGGVRKEDGANGDDEMKSPPVGPSRSGDGVEAGNEPSPPVAETGSIDEMEAIAGGAIGQSEDPLEALDSTLRPIERYAVRFVELEVPPTNADAVAAQLESAYKVEEFDVDAIEAAEEEREADIDEDEEANMVADWDQDAATRAYEEQRAAAEAAEREREAAEAAWMAQFALQAQTIDSSLFFAPNGALGGGQRSSGRGGGRLGGSSRAGGAAKEDADSALSPGAWGVPGVAWVTDRGGIGAENWYHKAKRSRSLGPPPEPWEPQEDLVLALVVVLLLEAGELPGQGLFRVASDVLAAGASATGMTGIEMAARQGARRSTEACASRYAQLRAAYNATQIPQESGKLDAAVSDIKSKLGTALGAANADETSRRSLAVVYTVLQKISASASDAAAHGAPESMATALLQLIDGLRSEVAVHGTIPVVHWVDAPGAAPAGSLEQARAIAGAVRQACGTGAGRVITQRLPAVLQAARTAGASLEDLSLLGNGGVNGARDSDHDLPILLNGALVEDQPVGKGGQTVGGGNR